MEQGHQNWETPEAIESLLNKVRPYTLLDYDRLKNLMRICRYLNDQNIPGDFVECGAYKGGSAAVISKYLGQTRKLWLYDSFQGLPEATPEDGEEALNWTGKCYGTLDDVAAVMQAIDHNADNLVIKEGWFHETFETEVPSSVALLHCDADWYDSVILVLEKFYDLIPEGGCVVLDDFGWWEGCRQAFYDFCHRRNEKPLLERIGVDQAYWIKGKAHNREQSIYFNQGLPVNLITASQNELESFWQQTRQELEYTYSQFTQAQQNLEQTQSQLIQAQQELGQTQQELGQTQHELGQTQHELGQTQFQLVQTQQELTEQQEESQRSRSKITDIQSRLQTRREQLVRKQEEIVCCQERIVAMESSKFWKIRKGWFKVKRTLGLPTEE